MLYRFSPKSGRVYRRMESVTGNFWHILSCRFLEQARQGTVVCIYGDTYGSVGSYVSYRKSRCSNGIPIETRTVDEYKQ